MEAGAHRGQRSVVIVLLLVLQVITSAEFHPQHCHVFAYSSSKGCIRVADMRNAALCDKHAKAFEEVDTSVSKLGSSGSLRSSRKNTGQ